jgi:predicted XRE-type DNA-binding protein
MQLLGKLFVPFEELQFFSDKEWNAIDSEIKDLITGDYASYTDKYEKRFDAKNTNNYIINSNFNAIKGANGRRYVVLDINTTYQNNTAYFKKIRDNCFNNKVGHAIYCYLYEIDTTKFNALDIPETQNKLDLIAELMTPIEKFLKETYILKQKGIKDKLKNVHESYVQFCTQYKLHYQSIQAFSKTLREYGIIYKKSDGYNKYDITFEFLDKLAKNKKWYHALDIDSIHATEDEEDPIEHGIEKPKTKRIIPVSKPPAELSLLEQIEYYEQHIKHLQEQFLDEMNSKFAKPKEDAKPIKKAKKERNEQSDEDFFQEIESSLW